MALSLFLNNDNLVQLAGLTDRSSGIYQNAATVTVSLYDTTGTTLIAGPTAMAHVANSNGDYEGVIPASTTLQVGTFYMVKVVAQSSNVTAEWDVIATVMLRERS